jgi:acyl-CoA reductase-like NAD-dependent aldehyde dehydrogenase
MRNYDKIYIGGTWVPSAGTGHHDVINASTEQVMGSVPDGTAADVDAAVKAARAAFPAWSATPVAERAAWCTKIHEAMVARADEIAETVSGEVGMPIGMSKAIQAGLPTNEWALTAKIVSDFAFEEQLGTSVIVREPMGVVGAITPWNYPLYQIVLKVAPAIATGNTVVLKPSEVAPLNAFIMAEIIDSVGLPAGVFNLVSGTGPIVGEAIAAHPDVDMVSFTGSTRAGRRVSEVAAGTIKRVALELGGKSANVILDDVADDDLPKIVGKGLGACFMNSGQTCSALTRMVVPRSKQERVIEILANALPGWTIGDPLAGKAKLGPVISESQRTRVRGYITKGVEEGATLVGGGAEQPDDLPTGYYVKPTVLANVTRDMTVAQEEIFGPVLVVMPHDGDDDALAIANGTDYGLAAAVWSSDAVHAGTFARRLRAGQVDVNGGGFNPLAPFGGYKQSGNGRERGPFGLEEFLETKSLQL